MRLSLFLLTSALVWAQNPDPAYEPLRQAYEALQNKQYDRAIESFQQAILAAPARPAIRKDLAYVYLKVGESEAARDQFAAAMRLDSADFHVALEYAFLCNENKMQAEARRVFDRVRKAGDAASRVTAEQAFENIDQPLASGIERWKKALQLAPESFTAHFELAGLAEQRDELALAAEHYRRAWQILPSRKQTLLDLGRVFMAMNRLEDANAALLAASRGGEPRAREQARELLPQRYPYVTEFRHALELDPTNVELRRDLAFLLLTMLREPEAEREFRILLDQSPNDLLSCAQLGFLYLIRDDKSHAMPLLERVLKGSDIALANRVRATLKMPLVHAEETEAVSSDAKVMAERSLKSGYLKDALGYLQQAHAADPADGWVMLKLGWTYNILHADDLAYHWFSLARASSDPSIASEARKAYNNLHPSLARFRTTIWIYPFFSTRWHDTFGYGQIKTDVKLGDLPFRPYISMRFFGDTRGTTGGPLPQYLSDSAVVVAAGVASSSWHGATGWFEAGSAIRYETPTPSMGRFTADYRGGISYGKSFGHTLGGESPGWFFESNLDGIYVSRYENDLMLYAQTRAGVTLPAPEALGAVQTQLFWNNNIIRDAKSLDWANYVETGPGLKFRWPWMPRSLAFTVSAVRGAYTVPQYYRRPNFNDVRAGFWYAITR